MAGSYRHIANAENKFRGTELLDNLGDAYEALQECYDMIFWLTGGNKKSVHQAWLQGHARKRLPPENEPLFSYEEFWYPDA